MKVVVLFDRFGPYHIARLEAASRYMSVISIEISGETSEYQWDKVSSETLKERITLFKTQESKHIPLADLKQALEQQLDKTRPDVIAINGWSDRSALLALSWSLRNNTPAVVMSESAKGDEKRLWWKEFLKKKIVQEFSCALVGGKRHKDYLQYLGMNENQIFFGYDVVDNGHFERGAKRAREGKKIFQEQKRLPENFFLVVSRFVEKKNLYNVILAYLDYYKKTNVTAWHLYVVGDGPLKKQLLDLVNQLHLEDFVHFEGFKQYDELPIYFGLAKAFVHASKTEQWGLVVNEAMASGLPVIISEPCGCVPELVHHGLNGYIIDPHNQNSLTKALLAISSDNLETERMGIESKKIIAAFDSDAFGTGLLQASKKAMHYKRSRGYITELILRVLIQR